MTAQGSAVRAVGTFVAPFLKQQSTVRAATADARTFGELIHPLRE